MRLKTQSYAQSNFKGIGFFLINGLKIRVFNFLLLDGKTDVNIMYVP